MPGFGRLYAPDYRDARFQMSQVLDPIRQMAFPHGVPEGSRGYKTLRFLDQGETGTCVEHGWTAKIEGGPVVRPFPLPHFEFYRLCVGADEIPENDHEAKELDPRRLQYGTTVRAGAKVAQKLGLLKNYVWTNNVDDVRAWHLVGHGGVVLGITWKTGMMQTDSDGFIHFTGNIEGGHCVATVKWSDFVKRGSSIVRAVRIQQSWKLPWGDRGQGFAWLEEQDLAYALADAGECCAATELKVKKNQPVELPQAA